MTQTFHPIVSDIFPFLGCTCGFFYSFKGEAKRRGGRHEFLPLTRNSSFLLEVEEENSFFVGGQFVWHFCDDMSRTRKNKRDKYLFSSMTHFLYSRNRKESNLKKEKKSLEQFQNWTLPTRHPKTKENQISLRIT